MRLLRFRMRLLRFRMRLLRFRMRLLHFRMHLLRLQARIHCPQHHLRPRPLRPPLPRPGHHRMLKRHPLARQHPSQARIPRSSGRSQHLPRHRRHRTTPLRCPPPSPRRPTPSRRCPAAPQKPPGQRCRDFSITFSSSLHNAPF